MCVYIYLYIKFVLYAKHFSYVFWIFTEIIILGKRDEK